MPQILALRDRGIWTDGQLATTHHFWEVSEKAVKQGWFPDTISTDFSRAPDGSPASVLVPMSEFLHLGLSLEKVIAGVTSMTACPLIKHRARTHVRVSRRVPSTVTLPPTRRLSVIPLFD